MAYIYIIKNDINDKVYIGKTHLTPQKRFAQHCRDMRRKRCERRPLYDAMRKHGPEHFYVETLEETDSPEAREEYWIKQYNSYEYGYNATLGGDGKAYVPHEPVLELYAKVQNQEEVAKQLGICECTVRSILHEHHVHIIKKPTQNKEVHQVFNGQPIQTFRSCGDAARHIINIGRSMGKINTVTSRITDCARHECKSAYGYQWEFT